MKKTLALTIFLLTASAVALASVRSITEDYQGNFLKYPLVKLTKEGIAHKINKDIEHSKENLKKKHSSMLGAADKISMSYKLLFENKDRINFLLYSYTYNNGAAHGQYYTEGFSYDLHSEKKASTESILEKIDSKLLDSGVREGRFTLTDGDNNPRQLTDFWKVETVSSECLINKDGSITLIYQPYDLAPYAYGNTFITIPVEELPYINGKRQNLLLARINNTQLDKKQQIATEKALQKETKLQQKRDHQLLKAKKRLDYQQEMLRTQEAKEQQELMLKQSKAYEKQTKAEAKLQQKEAAAQAKELAKQAKLQEDQATAKAKEQAKQSKLQEKQATAEAKAINKKTAAKAKAQAKLMEIQAAAEAKAINKKAAAKKKEQSKQAKLQEKQATAEAKAEKQNTQAQLLKKQALATEKAHNKQILAQAKAQEKQAKLIEKSKTKLEYQKLKAIQKQQLAQLKAAQKAQSDSFKAKHAAKK